MKRILGISLVGAVALFFSQAGCGECLMIMDCGSLVRFEIERDWGEGSHRIVVDADGEVATCAWAMPFEGQDDRIVCERAEQGEFFHVTFDVRDSMLTVHDAPETVRIQIFEAETEVFDESYGPEKTFGEPGQASCDEDYMGCLVEPIPVYADTAR